MLFRLFCVFLASGLVMGVSIRKDGRYTHVSLAIDERVVATCDDEGMNLRFDAVSLWVTFTRARETSDPLQCRPYVDISQMAKYQIEEYCAGKHACDFHLADIIEQEPNPVCLNGYDIIYHCV